MKAREHYSGDSDGLSDPEVLVGLIKVINPDYTDPGKGESESHSEQLQSLQNIEQHIPAFLMMNR